MEKMSRLLRIRTRRHALRFLIVFLILSYFITVMIRLRCTEVYSNIWQGLKNSFEIPDDVSCYHIDKPTDELKFIKKNAIYLISASCDSSLSTHHACVIESVMNTHGYDKKVYVFFSRPVTECACSEGLVKGLTGLPSLRFITIQIDKFVEDTPLKGIFKDNFLQYGWKRQAKVAEYLKFATLYKFGGVVIDLDIIMAKPVTFLGLNWGVRINGSQLGSAVVALTRKTAIGKSLIIRTIQLMKEKRLHTEVDGGLALTEAFRQLCYDRPVMGCSGFKIYDADLFYPYNKSHAGLMFTRGGRLQARTYGYYVWERSDIRRKSGSVYVQLMREYCPNVANYLFL